MQQSTIDGGAPSDVRILTGKEVDSLLCGAEHEIITHVRDAYLAFAAGRGSLPHSSFLKFDDSADRIIALPAYIGGDGVSAGIKWISSVPANTHRNVDRASAIIALNDRKSGRVVCLMEGAIISAKRTAASAALAAISLAVEPPYRELGLIGLGPINFEVLRFISATIPEIKSLHLFDISDWRIRSFELRTQAAYPTLRIHCHSDITAVLTQCKLVSFATTASVPHVDSLQPLPANALVLHLSLRDLSVDAILAANNVVDDVAHVTRARTSIDLAAERLGHSDFAIPLTDVLERRKNVGGNGQPIVFSPFGLGFLDISVAAACYRKAIERDVGLRVADFHPPCWQERA